MASASSAHQDSTAQLNRDKKRKATKHISFEVVRVSKNQKNERCSLKAIKPLSKVDVDSCPTVCLKEERADDERAFHIMHNVHHKNILSLKLLVKNKLQINDPSAVAAFVEPYDGTLWSSICSKHQYADYLGHIPSSTFQRYLREIISGLDFLIKNDLYHGNLRWNSTLYHEDTVKLAGFKLKESMNDNEAKWNDWLCFRKMLEDVLERVSQWNSSSRGGRQFFCGTLESLISMMKTLDCTSLPRMKEIILQDPFFWDFTQRVNFFAMTVSLKLSDADFINRVRNSDICKKPWDKNCTTAFQGLVKIMNDHREAERRKSEKNSRRGYGGGGAVCNSKTAFQGLVKIMNDHREAERRKSEKNSRRGYGGGGAVCNSKRGEPYNGNSVEHYVRCICGAFTHEANWDEC